MPSCPQCRSDLAEVETPAGAARGCDGCGHVWLDPSRIEALQATLERRYTPDDVRALEAECEARKQAAFDREIVYCRCPACGDQMLRRTYGEASYLLVHFCAAHGFWLHRDDLEAIASYIARGGEVLEMAHARETLERQLGQLERENRRVGRATEDGSAGFLTPFLPL